MLEIRTYFCHIFPVFSILLRTEVIYQFAVCKCFEIGPFQIVVLLTLYYTIQTFNTSGKESFRKHCGKRRKCWLPSIFSFTLNVFYPLQNKFLFFFLNLFCRLQMLSIWTSLKFCRLLKS